MKALDRATLRILRPEIDAALAALGKKHGVSFHAGNGTFSESFCTFKLEVQLVGADSPEADRFKRYAEMSGLDAEALGKTVDYAKREFRVDGLSPTLTKVMVTDIANGKSYSIKVADFIRAARVQVSA